VGVPANPAPVELFSLKQRTPPGKAIDLVNFCSNRSRGHLYCSGARANFTAKSCSSASQQPPCQDLLSFQEMLNEPVTSGTCRLLEVLYVGVEMAAFEEHQLLGFKSSLIGP